MIDLRRSSEFIINMYSKKFLRTCLFYLRFIKIEFYLMSLV